MITGLLSQLEFLPANLAGHMLVTVVALTLGLLLSVPLSIFAIRIERLRYPILTAIGLIQTIPGLALLALTIPLLMGLNTLLNLDISLLGFYPAIIALTLYSILPIVRNTVTGILDVDPSLTEAARGLGMTRNQSLIYVEIPMALPIIIAGIRTAAVWTIGAATLATPVGQRCLGNFIFRGLQTRNWSAVLMGCIASATLAICLDAIIAILQKGVENRKIKVVYFAAGLLIAFFCCGMISPRIVKYLNHSTQISHTFNVAMPKKIGKSQSDIVVGCKTFSEQYILQEVLIQRLKSAGFSTRAMSGLGSTVIFDALIGGEIDLYIDYTGTIWTNHMKQTRSYAPWKIQAKVASWLDEKYGISLLGSLGFENTYALAIKKNIAKDLKIEKIADLVPYAGKLKIGGDYEFFGRPEWQTLKSVYGLKFRDLISMDSTLMYDAINRNDVDVISAFSSDGRIDVMELLVMKDDRHSMPPYQAVILLSPKAAENNELVDALMPLIGRISVETMRSANYMVDREKDKYTIKEAAQWLIETIGL